MKTYFYILVAFNVCFFFLGNYSRWRKSATHNSESKPKVNTMTTVCTIIVILSGIGVIFTANSIVAGTLTALALFVIINPIISNILMNIFSKS